MNNNNNGETDPSPSNPVREVEDVNTNNYYTWYVPLHENNLALTFSPTQPQFFFQPKPSNPENTLHQNFNMETGFLPSNTETDRQPMGVASLTSDPIFATAQIGNEHGSPGFLGLGPLENLVSAVEQPYLFLKPAALKKNSNEANTSGGGDLGVLNDLDDLSFDGSGMDYDSDDFAEIQNGIKIGDVETSNANIKVGSRGGHRKGKKSGLPAKNLMAERRRREKLNDSLLLLRCVVPKISKMDRASTLADAIGYLKELLQKINVLNLELESTPSSSLLGPAAAAGVHPLTPTATTVPSTIKEKGFPPTIEVRQRDGGMVNIHMFCGRRPSLLLSIMRTLDSLGLDVQQAVISCFNGFALDIFRAKRCNEVHPDQIKGMLLESAGSRANYAVGF